MESDDTSSIDELKRAFEFVEVSSPGITDQLLSRIAAYLQHRYIVWLVMGTGLSDGDWAE